MAISKDFLQFVLDQLSNWEGVYYKRMFGGAALYYDGLAFGMLAHDMVYFKVDDNNVQKYLDAKSIQLKPFESHGTVLSFYSVPIEILEDNDKLIKWAKESYDIQLKRENK